jgi:cytoskeleton protein RodZ
MSLLVHAQISINRYMADFGATSLGDTLRAERVRQNLDLSAVAAKTKIRLGILEAIERNQFDCMPGGAYRPSFLRQYAHALRLDESEAIAAFHQQYEEPYLPLPTPPKRTRSWPILELGWLLITAAAVVGVYKIAESMHTIPAWKATGTAHKPPTVPAKPQTPAPVSNSGAGAGKSSTAEPPVRVAFTATEPVWMSVKCDGAASYTGTLLGPETKTFEASTAVTVVIGNAGGLAISLNGKPLGPIGAHGETRSLELTPSGVHRLPSLGSTKTINFEPRPENPN